MTDEKAKQPGFPRFMPRLACCATWPGTQAQLDKGASAS